MDETPGIDLIVGLGNPGSKYDQTRHNAGFWLVDDLAKEFGATLKNETKYNADIAKAQIGDRVVWLMKPQTYMNLSGKSVGPFANFYKIPADRILVVHDELDFAAGVARLKKGGGAGGHNGVTDIAQKLGSKEFYRMRIGIGRPDDPARVESWVLQRPDADAERAIREALHECRYHMRDFASGRFEDVTARIHSTLKAPAKHKE